MEVQMEEKKEASVLPAEQTKKRRLPRLKKRGRRILAAVLAAAVLLGAWNLLRGGGSAPVSSFYRAEQVTRRDLTVRVSGTATLEPADSYQVTTLLSGELQSAPFEEGDLVEEGTLLYTMDSSDAASSVSRAQAALYPTASIAGILNEVYVHDGDNVTAGEPIAQIVTSTDLTIDFMFTYVSPDQFYVGQSATVFVGNFDGPVQGTVVSVGEDTTITSNGKEVCTVRVKLSNPGILSDSYTASAVIGSYTSYGNAFMSMPASSTVYAAGSGTVTGFTKLVGAQVAKGETLCTVESDANRTQLETARLSMESAQLSAGSAAGTLDDYTIRSPISGTVIEKNFKAGDKVDGASSGSLAVIYDLSCLKMEMNVSELDIGKIQPGQTVEITADALPGQMFTGTVERVSISGTTTGGFTTYPVTIRLDDYGDLRPGMNVSADIVGDTAANVLCVPVDAVERGDTVLVPGPGAMTPDGTAVADPALLESRQVTLGRNDEQYIEITAGLEEGETVLVPDLAAGAGMGG